MEGLVGSQKSPLVCEIPSEVDKTIWIGKETSFATNLQQLSIQPQNMGGNRCAGSPRPSGKDQLHFCKPFRIILRTPLAILARYQNQQAAWMSSPSNGKQSVSPLRRINYCNQPQSKA
jgi:hypothetical protein